MKITFYGQSCFGIEFSGKHIVTDPFITGNELAKDIDLETIKADYILVSHGHQDHIYDLEALAKRTGATVIAAWEVYNWILAKGVENAHPMNAGGKWKFDFGTVRCVVAQHSSSFPDGTYAGNPLGYVVYNDSEAFYFAGDTALTYDMKLIPMMCPKLTCALLPIGDNFTMDVEQAVIASDFIECDEIIGCHYDTFGFIEIADKEAAKSAFSAKGKRLNLIEIGSSIEF